MTLACDFDFSLSMLALSTNRLVDADEVQLDEKPHRLVQQWQRCDERILQRDAKVIDLTEGVQGGRHLVNFVVQQSRQLGELVGLSRLVAPRDWI